jgi:preprotein translocase subunit SecB
MTEQNKQAQGGEGERLEIVRIYLKDVSFETPNSPSMFKDFKPEIQLQVNSTVNKLENDLYEVVLHTTVTSKQGDSTGFLVEVQQAGIFVVKGFDDARTNHILYAWCPNTLYPYAREVVSDLITKGTFPQVLLSPINFDSFYVERMKQREAEAASSGQGAH